MKGFPNTQEMILKQLENSLEQIAVDYWVKLKALHTNVKNDDPPYRTKGMSVIEIGSTLHYLYCRWWVESPKAEVLSRNASGDPVNYKPAAVTFRISVTLRHLRDDGGTFDEVVGNGTFDYQRQIEKFTVGGNPLSYILYDMWRATRNDIGASLFPSPDVDPDIITETITYEPASLFIPTPISHT